MGGPGLFLKVLPLYFSNRAETEPKELLGPFTTDAALLQAASASGLRITWFGHSSFLLEIDGFRVLVDPVWDQRASPFQWFGPKRFFAPTLPLEQLPELDAVLISHDHYDHLGAGTVRRLAQVNAASRARWITSDGVAKLLKKWGVPAERITELNWTESVELPAPDLGAPLRVISCPARHFSGRAPWNRFATLWASFVIEGPKHRVYFGADSGTWDGFAEITRQYGRFDLTLLEIGAFHPLWADIHLGPEGAAQAFAAMREAGDPGPLFPIHWGLFNLALHGWRQPIDRLTELAELHTLPLWLPEPGKPTEVTHNGGEVRSEWWKRHAL